MISLKESRYMHFLPPSWKVIISTGNHISRSYDCLYNKMKKISHLNVCMWYITLVIAAVVVSVCSVDVLLKWSLMSWFRVIWFVSLIGNWPHAFFVHQLKYHIRGTCVVFGLQLNIIIIIIVVRLYLIHTNRLKNRLFMRFLYDIFDEFQFVL